MTAPTGTAPATRGGARELPRYLPGLLLLAVIGIVAAYLQLGLRAVGTATGTALPDVEYVLWAILIGLVIRNTVGVPEIFRPGVGTYEFWLKIGIVLLGARFLLGDLAKLGGFSLGLILVDMAIATAVILLVGRLFGLGGKLSTLLAVGTSICGVSAIVASRGAIDADDEDSGYAIAAILALGAVALFSFPAIGHLLQLTDTQFGLWAGLAVDNTAETAATGAAYSAEAQQTAVAVKNTRNALIGVVVLVYAIYWSTRGGVAVAPGLRARTAFVWRTFPKFVLGFVVVSAVATAGLLSKPEVSSLGNLSKWAFLLCFAGVGLNFDIREMARSGWRPLIVAALGLVVVAACSLGLVLLTSGWLDAG
ncbi:YeiH family protein [Pseudonocardia endophytica]|uniref:Putative integral membrane protein (TIGR00698 family) n=1 Tax=Pseudonocardia endophytica TaxID=401976 RepID=A0A4R1HVY9_PSEEN|nr:putative sulfate exporter family transporter [Pseudonocardia endophytica]TCK25175.1 putative integral membrane protein (TIGR00698 family) [Pseudonocardia endophytica]